ncbi:VOC family protein [Candidatus Nitrosotenuis uzonensis]|uniref:Glyoxalase/bleomycin resistance protein/dioxygenase n=1 Tax=Candidatus Nitrosotenuis uzonensis TaxID=1407055 RepID=V6AT83_9ARCH|nr:VOC family protein [Candidatus Nitrosotenuis uzonensis]CDI05628.1 Glyoxalase/bleomycin resistance protein/dioxygenase [Candidatus Nitrosotenuis uzonensis]
MTKSIPDGFSTITASLTVKDASKAIEFYKSVFSAQEIHRFVGPDGKTIMHADLKIGDSILMLNDEIPHMNCNSPKTIGGTGSAIYLYVENSDDVFGKAVAAGAIPIMPIMDAFWGDRCGSIIDPFGHAWTIATHKKDMSVDEIRKVGAEVFKHVCQ